MIHKKKIQRIVEIVIPLLKKHGIARAGLFGSYARGEEKKDSDIDLLVKIKGAKSLLDVVHLQLELQNNLKKRVDLLEYNEINPYLKKKILSEEVRIL